MCKTVKKIPTDEEKALITQLLNLQDDQNLELEQPFNLMAIENCLCEYSKYMKIKMQHGYAKSETTSRRV